MHAGDNLSCAAAVACKVGFEDILSLSFQLGVTIFDVSIEATSVVSI